MVLSTELLGLKNTLVESLEKTLQEREAPNDLLAYEKMLNNSGHQGNTKYTHSETSAT